jgi:hypothetical protein
MADKITKSHLIGSEQFRSIWTNNFKNPKYVCEKYYICMLSTNVNQYLAFRPLHSTWWVYEWGAQVRKHKYGKSPTLSWLRFTFLLMLLISLSSYPFSLLIYVAVRLCAMISLRDFARICAAVLVKLFRLIS